MGRSCTSWVLIIYRIFCSFLAIVAKTWQIITRVFQSKSSPTTLPIYLVKLLISNSIDLKREKKINNVYHFENFCDKICLVILNDLPKKECFNLQNVLFFLLDKGFIHHHPSLNTQSCIRGLLVVRDFCFWAV